MIYYDRLLLEKEKRAVMAFHHYIYGFGSALLLCIQVIESLKTFYGEFFKFVVSCLIILLSYLKTFRDRIST
jgi:hypothetical protein